MCNSTNASSTNVSLLAVLMCWQHSRSCSMQVLTGVSLKLDSSKS